MNIIYNIIIDSQNGVYLTKLVEKCKKIVLKRGYLTCFKQLFKKCKINLITTYTYVMLCGIYLYFIFNNQGFIKNHCEAEKFLC